MRTATALAHPNIAFIKYWGNRNEALRLPSNSSLSMNLAGLETRTQVDFDEAFHRDELILNGAEQEGAALVRVSAFLDLVRSMGGIKAGARVESTNNFPSGAGVASSASAFAALALAASRAAGLDLDEAALSRLARRGSGSASRSVPGGFVEWRAADKDEDSFAYSVAPAGHWDLVDCIAVVSEAHKSTGSTQGHALAGTSPLQGARVAGAEARLGACREALLDRDFAALAEVAELDSHLMHAVMMTSNPRLLYWQPGTMAVLLAVADWREEGLQACTTIDAGPNVHVICTEEDSRELAARLAKVEGVQAVIEAPVGGPTRVLEAA